MNSIHSGLFKFRTEYPMGKQPKRLPSKSIRVVEVRGELEDMFPRFLSSHIGFQQLLFARFPCFYVLLLVFYKVGPQLKYLMSLFSGCFGGIPVLYVFEYP